MKEEKDNLGNVNPIFVKKKKTYVFDWDSIPISRPQRPEWPDMSPNPLYAAAGGAIT